MALEKYYIIIDTNQLGRYKDRKLICDNFNYLSVNKDIFLNLICFIKDNSLDENIKIIIPKMVFEELKSQQIRCYENQTNDMKNIFSKFVELPDFNLNIPNINYEQHLDQKIAAFVSKYDIIQLDYPSNKILPKLISKVLNRVKPFYKKKGGKDSGFKDAIIWESILAFAIQNKGSNFIFFTADHDFVDTKLSDEFRKLTGNNIKILCNLSDIKTFLDETQQLRLDFSFIKHLSGAVFMNNLYFLLKNNFFQIELEDDIYNIIDFDRNFELIDISALGGKKFQLTILFNVIHETPYTGYSVVDISYALYEEETHQGIIILTVKKTEENKLALIDHNFKNIQLLGNRELPKVVLN